MGRGDRQIGRARPKLPERCDLEVRNKGVSRPREPCLNKEGCFQLTDVVEFMGQTLAET